MAQVQVVTKEIAGDHPKADDHADHQRLGKIPPQRGKERPGINGVELGHHPLAKIGGALSLADWRKSCRTPCKVLNWLLQAGHCCRCVARDACSLAGSSPSREADISLRAFLHLIRSSFWLNDQVSFLFRNFFQRGKEFLAGAR